MSPHEVIRIICPGGTIRIPLLWACEQWAAGQACSPEGKISPGQFKYLFELARAEPDRLSVWLFGHAAEMVRPVAELEAPAGAEPPLLSELWEDFTSPTQIRIGWSDQPGHG